MLDVDLATEISKPPYEAVNGLGPVPSVKVIGAEVVVLNAVAEHEIGRSEHGGGNGEDGLLRSTPGLDAKELRTQVAVLLARGRPGGGDQGCFQPGAAL